MFRADNPFGKVGSVDLEEELEQAPLGDPVRVEDDLDRLGVTRMVPVGRVVVLPTGVSDPGRNDSIAVAQQFLRGPEAASGEDRGLGVAAHRVPSFEVVLKTSLGRSADHSDIPRQRSRPPLSMLLEQPKARDP